MNQRVKKPGLWSASWCASCASCFLRCSESAVVLIYLGSLRLILRGRGLVGRGLLDGSCGGCGRLRAGHMSAVLADPLRELRLRHDLDRNRHEAVTCAAQLGTLPEIDARTVDLGPRLVELAGVSVVLDPEGGHGEAM